MGRRRNILAMGTAGAIGFAVMYNRNKGNRRTTIEKMTPRESQEKPHHPGRY